MVTKKMSGKKTTKTVSKKTKTTKNAGKKVTLSAKGTKSSKSTKSTKTTKAKKTEVSPPVPPTVTAVTEETTSTSTSGSKKLTSSEIFEATVSRIQENYDTLIAEVDALAKTSKALSSRLKKTRKQSIREVTQLYKKTRSESKKRKQRKPSGFAKPSLISDELCEFLGEPKGTEMARTAVTTRITNYIKENGLQNPDNKKQILLDTKLGKLIQVGPGEDALTYFNIQKYMKHHYKPVTSSAATAAVV